MAKFKSAITIVALLAAIVIFLVQNARVESLREERQSLCQQFDQLSAETERLTNSPPQPSALASKDAAADLLRLRAEVSALRKQTNDLGKLRAENDRMRTALASARQKPESNEGSEPPPDEEKLHAIARITDSRTYVLAFLMHAEDNQQRLATNFDQIAPYLYKDRPVTGTNEFDIVFQGPREGVTNASSIILLRERQPRQRSDGRWTRAYGFLDGHSEIHTEPTSNFDSFEQQHILATP